MKCTKLNNLRSFGLEVLEALTLSRWSGMMCLFVLLCLGSVAKAEEYNLYIAGTQVTSDNATNILGDGAASYDASSNTLIISGDITAPDNEKSCIEGEMDNLTIIVAATAKLSSTACAISITGKKTTITGDKTLTIVTPGKPSSYAIQNMNGDLCITNANLSLEGSLGCGLGKMSINHTNLSINGIIANFGGDVDITDSNVSVKSTNESAIHGAGGKLSIDNSSVSATTMASSTSAIAGWVSLETVCYLKIPQGGHYDTETKKFIEADGNLALKVEISPRFIEGGLYYDQESSNTVKLVSPTEGSYFGAITIPAVVKHNDVTYDVVAIGDNAFKGATGVTSVTLPLTNLTSIGSFAFNDCTGLTEFTLPECITCIGERAFFYCDKLQHLYVHSSDPSNYNAGSMAFSSINRAGNVCTLHVPTGTTAAYTADNSPFQAFTKVEEFTKYDLSVAGTLVTSLNATDVLGDGVASYDASKNTLSVSGNITAPDAVTPCIKSGIEGLTINVTAPAELKATNEAIYLSKTATITGSSLLTISVSSDDAKATAIFQKDGDIYVTDANLSAVGLMWCIGGKIDITNTTISNLGGIYCFSSNTNITNSTVSVNGIHGIGIVGFGALRIDNSTVNATIPDPSSAIGLWGAVTLSNCYYKTPQGGYYDAEKRVLVDAEGNPAPTVEIVPGDDPYLYIAGKCVTSKNASDILGNGVASYDEDTKTLTICGDITAPDADTPCIKSGVEGLTIQVAAPSELRATNEAIYLQGSNTTITGTSLVVSGKICCPDGNLNIINSTLACLGDITGGRVLEISKSTVSATASDFEEPVIAGWESLTLTGCTLLTPERGRYNTENKMLVDDNGVFAPMVVISNGDASGDGKLDNDDITAIVNYIMTGQRDGFDIDNADLNGDGKVDLADLVLLINKMKE